ncbi:C-X-C chemokine receptor type 3-like [Archocentrus centrarchus]|uniref:C-X-C chemokine receptor type 3-like n=1 Tax=Archocentrus centrarchus TaxID=63155 RepID=UPI0011EA0BF2|nr:C-X-C chemokine receptor type 3-like [Archocentrus centrarchus]
MNMDAPDADFDGIFNSSDDYDPNITYDYKEYPVKRGSEAVWIPALYSVVFFVGILGNIILLTALVQKRRLWSISDTFILHLSFSDILLLLMLPFWAAKTTQHCDGFFGIISKIFAAVFKLNYYCGIFLLVFITLESYLFVIRGIQLYCHGKPWLAHFSCLSIWVISVLLTVPDWIFLVANKNSTEEKTCLHDYPQSGTDWQLWSRLLHHIVGFVLPGVTLMICFCCSHMLWQHCRFNGLPAQRNVAVILSLVVVFCLCWVPYNFILILDTLKNRLKEHPLAEISEDSLKTLLMVTSALGCLHASLRPLLYLGLCGNFREHLLAMLRCKKMEPKGSLWDLGLGQREQPDHSRNEGEALTVVDNPMLSAL